MSLLKLFHIVVSIFFIAACFMAVFLLAFYGYRKISLWHQAIRDQLRESLDDHRDHLL